MRKISVPISIKVLSLNDEAESQYIEWFKAGGVERVFLTGFSQNYTTHDWDKVDAEVERVRKHIRAFQQAGFEVGIWISGFGHGSADFSQEETHNGMTITRGPDGDGDPHGVCPLDENVQEYYLTLVRKVITTSPDFLLLDDDYRYSYRSYGLGCFCKLHMRAIQEYLGEEFTSKELYEKMMSGGPNRYREAYQKVMKQTLLDFARKVRMAVDEVNPFIRVSVCMSPSTMDVEGTDAISLAQAFAGDTKPYIRLIGAPYWQTYTPWGDVISAVEYTRMQAQWCRQAGLECMAEGDVFPRPRYTIPANHLELYDQMLVADGAVDYIHKYMFNYGCRFDYETGYIDRHLRNQNLYHQIDELFAGKKQTGIYIYEAMHKFADSFIEPQQRGNKMVNLLYSAFGRAQQMLAHNSLSTTYIPTEGVVAAFGENARSLPEEYMSHGIITDWVGAKILTERGIDCGWRGGEHCTYGREHFLYAEDNIDVSEVSTCRMKCDENAEVMSRFLPDNTVASYRYENAEGQRFCVFAYDSYDTDPKIGRPDYYAGYYRNQQLVDVVKWMNSDTLNAVTFKNPNLYLRTSRNAESGALAVGLFNAHQDDVCPCVVELDKVYSSIRFVNCEGVMNGNRVIISRIEPYGMAAFEVC